jgi:hypothetical protein
MLQIPADLFVLIRDDLPHLRHAFSIRHLLENVPRHHLCHPLYSTR